MKKINRQFSILILTVISGSVFMGLTGYADIGLDNNQLDIEQQRLTTVTRNYNQKTADGSQNLFNVDDEKALQATAEKAEKVQKQQASELFVKGESKTQRQFPNTSQLSLIPKATIESTKQIEEANQDNFVAPGAVAGLAAAGSGVLSFVLPKRD